MDSGNGSMIPRTRLRFQEAEKQRIELRRYGDMVVSLKAPVGIACRDVLAALGLDEVLTVGGSILQGVLHYVCTFTYVA